jgi:acyl dehydratase
MAAYFEDFSPGTMMRHPRGKTVSELDNVLLCNLMLNTADGHFNADSASRTSFGRPMVFGGVITALVVGLASEDTAEEALAELALDSVRFRRPVFHGDTLYAVTEVLEASPRGELAQPAGEVRFHHWGLNQTGEIVFECERTVLVAKRPTGTQP